MYRRCMICNHAEAKQINLLLLASVGKRDGTVRDLAERLNCDRNKLWTHRKQHLMGQRAPTRVERLQKRSRLSFQSRAWELSEELRRLQLMVENGMPAESSALALKILQSRKSVLEMECRLESGMSLKEKLRRAGRKAGEVDPEEEKRITKEYMDVCMAPELAWGASDEESAGAVDARAGVIETEDAGEVAG
jgi:hypothetical protein